MREMTKMVDAAIDSAKKGQIVASGSIDAKNGAVKRGDGSTEVNMSSGLDKAKVIVTPNRRSTRCTRTSTSR